MSEVPTAGSRPAVSAQRPAQWGTVRGPSRAFVATTAVLFVLMLVTVVMDWVRVSTVRSTAAAWARSSDPYGDRLDDLSAALGVFTAALGVAVAGAVLFVVWMSRARTNSELLGPGPHRLSRGVATGGWFIPLANLWLGKVAIEDVWRASAPSDDERRSGLVTAWWVTLLGSVGVYLVGVVLNPRPVLTVDMSGGTTGGLDAVESAARFVAVTNTMLFVLAGIQAVLFCAIILRITAWQETATVRPDAVVAGYGDTWAAGGPPPAASLRPVRRPGRNAVVLGWIWTVLFGVAAVCGSLALAAQARRDGDGVVMAGIGPFLAFLLGLAVLVAAGIVFAAWCRRALGNASVLDRTPPAVSPEWATASCFVPIANLVVPARVVLAVARPAGVGAGLVGAWWIAWLGAWAAFWFSFPWPGRRLGTAALPMWLPAGLFVVAAVLLTVIVAAVARHQEPAAVARHQDPAAG